MSQEEKKIGILIGSEKDWPEAFIEAINKRDDGITAEMIKLGGLQMDDEIGYDVIIDRISYEIPYYRAYLKYAALQGAYLINNTFTWSADNKFVGTALIKKLGLLSPRTVVLPNKNVAKADLNAESFRNLKYPMDWDAIIEYVGVPAIFKNVHVGGRYIAYRVHDIDELLQRYDESGTLTMLLQEVIESDDHIHCFVFGREHVYALRYSLAEARYLPEPLPTDSPLCQRVTSEAMALTKAYGYDINMVEFVVKDDEPYVINSTNPTPEINRTLMADAQFDFCVQKSVEVAVSRAQRPLPQRWIIKLEQD